jgi:hypothetical protein
MNGITTNRWIHRLYTQKFLIKISVKIKQMMSRWLMLRPKGGSELLLFIFILGKQMEKFIAKNDAIDFTRQKNELKHGIHGMHYYMY